MSSKTIAVLASCHAVSAVVSTLLAIPAAVYGPPLVAIGLATVSWVAFRYAVQVMDKEHATRKDAPWNK